MARITSDRDHWTALGMNGPNHLGLRLIAPRNCGLVVQGVLHLMNDQVGPCSTKCGLSTPHGGPNYLGLRPISLITSGCGRSGS